MFAVPGWSVSADKLKSEVASAPANAAEPKKSKKRKRQPENVTSSNVADLWERVIEQKKSPVQNGKSQPQPQSQSKEKQGKKDRKKQKVDYIAPSKEAETHHEPVNEKSEGVAAPSKTRDKTPKKEQKGKKDKQKSKETKNESQEAADVATSQKSSGKAIASAVIPAPPKLTPLQASMREKLVSARFRHLNETLYTRPSAEAFSLFEGSPDMFIEYHEGFRRQVEVWPQNPVEGYLADIRQRGRARFPSKDDRRHQKKAKQPQEQQEEERGNVQPLPRNRATGTCTIADLGCGDARLASELQSDKKRLRLDILSFDLHSPHPLVTKADIANLPVANGTVDVAIFCLALMGTNWVDFIEEAYRILRWKGELWVAEIKSRFGHVGGGRKKAVVEHSVGHRKKPGAIGVKKAGNKPGGNAGADETTLLVEVDGVDDTRQQTDVSAFIKVLNQRGFVLVGQDQGPAAQAIDLSNKMFVKMRFLKAAPALKGKCVRQEGEEGGKSRLGGRLPAMAKKPKFLDTDDEAESDEAAVLKPCVYKTR